ncbi:MAG TPA: ectonucleotide pyrophosphatase/phosphodiesterase [Acidobacteriaceae bacterium]|jgi:alkaline phosphatase D|nr:ectonucleotide pyrophosphatase/phosphodiesterase [Acidobacteriaceae bacterium]
MMKLRLLAAVTFALFGFTAARAQDLTPVIHVDNSPNLVAQQSKHYVVLVSLDGFRYDYAREYGAPHLEAMAKDGVSTPTGMLPSYPSVTFPNHYALVTGLWPEHHGIVAMEFYDPLRKESYAYSNSKENSDGTWYQGTPLWVLAEQQGMRSACFFWPGSEAAIDGVRPSYYLHYDESVGDVARIDQVIAWLKLPAEQRPHFITLYYPNTDTAGHEYGPDSPEEREAVHHVDEMMGDLRDKLRTTGLPVDLIVTADHGMIKLDPTPVVLDQFADLSHFRTEGKLLYAETEADAERAYEQFRAHPDPRFTAYRRADVPKSLHYDTRAREGDPVIVPNGPYSIYAHPPKHKPEVGSHGFDPHRMPQMKAIFYAEGPDIRAGVKLASFDNVDVYSFIARLLGLEAPPNDGTIGPLLPALKR